MNRKYRLWLLMPVLCITGFLSLHAQELRWMRVGEAQGPFIDYGSEHELLINTNFFTWPTQYSDNQTGLRATAMWIGARNFYDPVQERDMSVKVISAGPRLPENQLDMTFPQSIRLIAREQPPLVVVDDQIGTNNTLYDKPDDYDENLPCDRMIVIKLNTSMGVSITKKILGFTQQNHDDYFIFDWVFKNTGIYNADGDRYEQMLDDFWAYFAYRPAFSGVTSLEWGSTWGAFSSQWGGGVLTKNLSPDFGNDFTGWLAWMGPHNERPVPYEADWGTPNHQEKGWLGTTKYIGAISLYASKSPSDWSNNPNQPGTTAYTGSDGRITEAPMSQYDEQYMADRYHMMTEGHLDHSQFQAVGEGVYADDWVLTQPYRDTGTTGSTSMAQGFGPYDLAPGDSVRIVYAFGANGLSWPEARRIGGNWFAYYSGSGTPELILPDGNIATNENIYTKSWVATSEDSIMQTLENARTNFESDYHIPQAPPAPETFTVKSGGDRILITWADNATSHPYFDGYVIYRSEGSVKQIETVYEKIFECDASTVVHTFDDVTASRGFDYYYYIQSKDDGSQNDVEPGRPLYSSMFLTLTSIPANLLRPAGTMLDEVRVVPNPYDIRARVYQFGEDFQYDRITFFGLPPFCQLKIFTERGDLIWEKEHTNGSGDEIWDCLTSSRQIVVSGIYILYVEVTENVTAEEDVVARHDYYNGKNITRTYSDSTGTFSYVPSNEPVYKKDDVLYPAGSVIYKKGESVYRKFVIIR
ncbi:hypothetical protein JW948_00305 [bacterium]|nr:hypothetical protein [bacterium]